MPCRMEQARAVGNGCTLLSSAGETPRVPGTGSSSKKCRTSPEAGSQRTWLHALRSDYPPLGCVVVVASLRLPRTNDVRVERPVRNVHPMHAIDQRLPFQPVGRQPFARVPAANLLADVTFGDLERQEALRAYRRLDLLIVDERRRSAEVAVLPDTRRIEHGDRLATLALHRPLLGQPAAFGFRCLAKCLGEIVLAMASTAIRVPKFRRKNRRAAAAPDSTRPARHMRSRDIFRVRRRRSWGLADCEVLRSGWREKARREPSGICQAPVSRSHPLPAGPSSALEYAPWASWTSSKAN